MKFSEMCFDKIATNVLRIYVIEARFEFTLNLEIIL